MIENQSVKVQVETCPSTPPPDGKVKGESMSRDHESRAIRCRVVQDIVNKKRHFDGEDYSSYSTSFDIPINTG